MGRHIFRDRVGCRRIRFLRYCGRGGKHCQDPFLSLFGHLRRAAHCRISRRPQGGFLGSGLSDQTSNSHHFMIAGLPAVSSETSCLEVDKQSLPVYAALRPDFRPRALAVLTGFTALALLSTLRFKSAIRSMTSPFAGFSSSSSDGSVIISVCPA